MEDNQFDVILPDKKPQKQVKLSTAIVAATAALLAGVILTLAIVPNPLRMWIGGDSAMDKLSAVEAVLDQFYIGEIDKDKLVDTMAWGYVYGLGDPYSTYYDAETYTEVLFSNGGNSYGIGVNVAFYGEQNAIYICSVVPDSPAEQAGLKKGDLIVTVDGASVTEENYAETVDNIRGEINTAVNLGVKRDGEVMDFAVTRNNFATRSVTGRMIGDAAYIDVSTFNETTAEQFDDVLDSLSDKATRLIIDLRGNAGGLVDAANKMLDRLLPKCEIGYAVYKNDRRVSLGKSDAKCIDIPVIILVDNGSASSSEYFSSAMRDSGGAILVGETTFGKGIMQSTYRLGDGSAVKVTVAKIYTASGTEFHGVGLKPDIEVSYTEEELKHWFLLEDRADPYIATALDAKIK